MPKLNQILAIEKSVKSKANDAITAIYHQIQKSEPLIGIARTYSPLYEGGDILPSETTLVQVKVVSMLEALSAAMTELFDITAVKDYTNLKATANVKIGTRIIIRDAPVSYLLWLEKQLTDLYTILKKMPTLDPALTWTYDQNRGFYVSQEMKTNRTKKVYRNHVRAEATDKHPAQVETYTEDEIVGTWSTVRFSGALPADVVATYMSRVEELQKAVKFAREEANSIEAEKIEIGAAVMEFVFSGSQA